MSGELRPLPPSGIVQFLLLLLLHRRFELQIFVAMHRLFVEMKSLSDDRQTDTDDDDLSPCLTGRNVNCFQVEWTPQCTRYIDGLGCWDAVYVFTGSQFNGFRAVNLGFS